MLTVGQIGLLGEHRAEQRVQVTQWGRWRLVTPYVTYIGNIWRESKLGCCLLQFGSIHLLACPSLYNSELLERD